MSILILVSCKNAREARKIAKALLGKKLVACANIVPKVESHYWWKKKIRKDSESLLLLKTNKRLQGLALKVIEKEHSYKLPVIELVEAKADSLVEKWIEKETK